MIWGDFPPLFSDSHPSHLPESFCPSESVSLSSHRNRIGKDIVFQSHHFSEDFAVKLREGGRWYAREIPEKDWILPAAASNWSNSSRHHFITASFFLMQNNGDVTIVYTHLVTFKHPTDMAFIHKYITTSPSQTSQTWCQPHKTRETFKCRVDTPADIPYA